MGSRGEKFSMLLRKFVRPSPSESRCLVLSTLSLFIEVGEWWRAHTHTHTPHWNGEYSDIQKANRLKMFSDVTANDIEITLFNARNVQRSSSYFICRLFLFSLLLWIFKSHPLACGDRNQIRCRRVQDERLVRLANTMWLEVFWLDGGWPNAQVKLISPHLDRTEKMGKILGRMSWHRIVEMYAFVACHQPKRGLCCRKTLCGHHQHTATEICHDFYVGRSVNERHKFVY